MTPVTSIPTRFTAAQLSRMTLPEPNHVVPGLVPVGLSGLFGKPKVGKSHLGLQLALAVATGGEFLGRQLDQGNVLYIALEDSPQRILKRLIRALDGQPAPDMLQFWTASPRISKSLVDEIENHWAARVEKPLLVIIDTMGRAMPEGKNKQGGDYDFYTQTLGGLQGFALDNNLSAILVHHARKDSKETAASSDVFDSVLGTIGINGVMDSMLLLTRLRGSDDGVIHVTGRDFDEDAIEVKFNADLFAWELREPNILANTTPDQLQVLQAIAAGSITPKDIATHTGKGVKNIQNMLSRALDRGLIRKTKPGEYELTEPAKRSLASDPRGSSVSSVVDDLKSLTEEVTVEVGMDDQDDWEPNDLF